ncbi:hypothetical protein RN001_001136 [Aquatica leii]|uniref:Uncharacterized protein n=1 Tax=Aquatica leii TaxID=1421715 RepID=A0AAN7SSK7_9COLE|nr:hypothetical protein RN001_001136 [Aquatica leii]
MNNPATCPAKQWQCYNCSKHGHTSTGESDESLVLGHIGQLDWNKKEDAYQVEVRIEGQQARMEVDSEACRSVMHKSDFVKLSCNKLQPDRFKLNVITGHNVNIEGQSLVNVEFMVRPEHLPIVILNSINKFAPLMSRDWITKFIPSWKNALLKVNNVKQSPKVNVVELVKANELTA